MVSTNIATRTALRRVRQFHSQNTALDHQAMPGFASSFGGDVKVASGDRFGLRTAGDVTNQGVPIGATIPSDLF